MKKYKDKYWYPLVLLLFMVLSAVWCKPVFYLNDDVTMRSILSGAYTGKPDGHAVYMQYPLTILLALLYSIVPVMPWMELFFAGCIWVCMIVVVSSFEKKWFGILFVWVMYLPLFWYMHYSIVAAAVAATAVFAICKEKKTVLSVSLLLIAYMIRNQIGLLSLPFVLAAWVWNLLQKRKEGKKVLIQGLRYIGIVTVGLGLVTLIHYAGYADYEWQKYLTYNESRTLLYDYTDFVSTDKYAKEYAAYGMTEEEYGLLFSYNTMLDTGIDGEKMQDVAQKVRDGMQGADGGMAKLKACIKKYYFQFRYSEFPYNYIWIAGVGLLVLAFIWYRKWLEVLFVGILEAGRSIIWIYLLWKGRFPERIAISLYLIELLLLLGVAITGIHIKGNKLRMLCTVVCVTVCVLAGQNIWMATFEKVKLRNTIQEEWDVLKDYCENNSQNRYLLDVFSSVKYADRLFEEDSDNLMLMGGWMTESPLAKERITRMGGTDLAEVLLKNPNAYLVISQSRDTLWIENYLKRRFGDVQLVCIEECYTENGGFEIYGLQ